MQSTNSADTTCIGTIWHGERTSSLNGLTLAFAVGTSKSCLKVQSHREPRVSPQDYPINSEEPTAHQAPQPTCDAVTSKGTVCRRRVNDDEKQCWQHARGVKRKWHSLTRDQSISFMLAAVGVLIGLLAWTFPQFWNGQTSSTTQQLTAYVHGPAGRQDLVVKNEGQVVLELGAHRLSERIGDKGQAYFLIPPEFRGHRVPVGVESEAYETATPNEMIKLDTDSIYVQVRRKSGHISGRVEDVDGNPVPGASIQLAGLSVSSGLDGRFEVSIPGGRMKPELSLTCVAGGYKPQMHTVVPNANEITIMLERW